MTEQKIRFAFAGDRDIAVWVLEFILSNHYRPELLILSSKKLASHDQRLIELCPFLSEEKIIRGNDIRLPKNIQKFKDANLDYIFGIHFPYIIPPEVLKIPKVGVINLHPAYLPFNRGWHTPSWAILEGTPIGATLHFMEEELDSGDIILQEKIEINPEDTADSLYLRLKHLEFEVFKKAWPLLINKNFSRIKQNIELGTYHVKKDLFSDEIQLLELNKTERIETIIKKLRALTTNELKEAAYFIKNGKKYRIQIKIIPEE